MDEKQAYRKMAQAELDLLQARLEELKAKARLAEAGAEVNLQRQIGELKAKREAAWDKLVQIDQAGHDAWRELKEGLNRALGELKAALDQAAARFK